MTFHLFLTSKLIFYNTVLGPFYRPRVFMRTIYACHLTACILGVFRFFFAFTQRKISDVIGLTALCRRSFRPTA